MDKKGKTLLDIIRELLEDLDVDVVEDRIVEYIVRGLRDGRELRGLLADPYITNRLGENQAARLVEQNPEIIETVEKQIKATFEKLDFKFND